VLKVKYRIGQLSGSCVKASIQLKEQHRNFSDFKNGGCKKYVLNFSFIAEIIIIEEYIFINHLHLNTVTFKRGTLQSLLTFFYYLNLSLTDFSHSELWSSRPWFSLKRRSSF
jgi:hypothetical protein